jgi:hypothetical protein
VRNVGCFAVIHYMIFLPELFYMSSQRQIWSSPAGRVERRNYNHNEIMSGIIAPTGASSVTVQFTFFSTESGYDILTLKSCTAISCLQTSTLGTYSGSTIPSPVTSNSGIILIQWATDSSVIVSGWTMSWSSVNPGGMNVTDSARTTQPVHQSDSRGVHWPAGLSSIKVEKGRIVLAI